MLDAFEGAAPLRCVEYSSLQSHAERTRALEAFRTRAATVLVASDAATRGLDVEVRRCEPCWPSVESLTARLCAGRGCSDQL
jgi:hypothetical protein